MDIRLEKEITKQRENGDVPFMAPVTINLNNISTKHPSQTLSPYTTLRYKTISLPNQYLAKNMSFDISSIKGMSPFSLCRASMTVEAAILLPMFLFFFLNLFSIIEIYRLHSNLTAALRETGRDLSVYAYAYNEYFGEEQEGKELLKSVENVAFSNLYVKAQVEKLCGKEYIDRSPLYNGRAELNYLFSTILGENDEIDLVITYRVKPFNKFIGYFPDLLFNRYYGRAWTGYDVEAQQSQEKEYVFVTESAEVYHTNRDCSHLKIKIIPCFSEELKDLRNRSGEIYKPCEKCCKGNIEPVFICQYGNRFHEDKNCSGLKRTIMVMPLNEANKRYPICKECSR